MEIDYKVPHFGYFVDDFWIDKRITAAFILRLFMGDNCPKGSYHFVIDGYNHNQHEPTDIKNPGTSVEAFRVMADYFGKEYFTDLGDIARFIFQEHPEAFAGQEYANRNMQSAKEVFQKQKMCKQLGWPYIEVDHLKEFLDIKEGTRPLLRVDIPLNQYYIKQMMRIQSLDIIKYLSEQYKSQTEEPPEEIEELVTMLGEM